MFQQVNMNTSTRVVGSFTMDADRDFKDNLMATMENFQQTYQMSPVFDFTRIIQNDVLFVAYKNSMFSDLLDPAMETSFAHCDDGTGFMSVNADKLDQLVNNTRDEMVAEAANVGQLVPIVALTLPILKKEYLAMNFKDVLQTVVADKPDIKIAYERKFLKDVQGNKYYIPDIFYDKSYREITDKSVGKEVSSKWYTELPLQELDMLAESGGSLERRDQLSYDFRVKAVKVDVAGDSGTE